MYLSHVDELWSKSVIISEEGLFNNCFFNCFALHDSAM